MTKERIYDEQISPLMAQIIAICKEHKIPIVATFHTPNEEDETLSVTTALLGNGFDAPPQFSDMLRAIRPDLLSKSVPMMRTQHSDGSTTLTAFI